ncbi:MAG: fibrobacter succinogenes major paralogous domain-containing protein [Fibromonadales bacterium]|nr:fibrobacter succinogenes major paralogous domain-containing protein [Fibromonadales bacterium]
MLFGCAEIERENPYDPGGVNYVPPSSSSRAPSSSSLIPLSSSVAPSSSSLVPSSSSLFVGVPCGNASTGSATVTCDGKTYKTVKIGTQTWMAENLNYDVPDNATDVCYDNNSNNCATYGRLYNWSTAMALDPSCNSSVCASQVQSKHRGICPSGWHIPSYADWGVLMTAVGGVSIAGTKLKATSGWSSCGPSGSGSSYSCEDTYGFSALPGGYGFSDGSFDDVGDNGYWWSASEYSSDGVFPQHMGHYYEGAHLFDGIKTELFAVRCQQD